MERYVEKAGKRLRYGFTTGSCAAGAAKAAATMLFAGKEVDVVSISTPKGWDLDLDIEKTALAEDQVSCQIKKDAGDDPDSTHGMYVGARVKKCPNPGIHIMGGEGVGIVTKKGLDQPVGAHAINSVPRAMITKEVEEVVKSWGYVGGLDVKIFVPDGTERAQKTYNPRIGIEGGISIIGTTGIVEPMSEKALLDSLQVELNVIRNNGSSRVVVFPGNYGKQFAQEHLDIPMESSIKIGNHFGEVLSMISKLDFPEAIFVGHIGKMVKLAGGIMNTHSHHSDSRMEILAAYAALYGGDASLTEKILSSATCDDALDHLSKAGLRKLVMDKVVERVEYHLRYKLGQNMDVKIVLFSNVHGILSWNQGALPLIREPYPVSIVGMGPGHPDYVLPKAWQAIREAQILLGGKRHLEGIKEEVNLEDKELIYVEDGLAEALEHVKNKCQTHKVACLVSGDPGFYSLTGYMKRNAPEVAFQVVPGISSVTYLFSKLQKLWHHAEIISFHGKKEFPMDQILSSGLCVLLTDGQNTPDRIARALMEKGDGRRMIVAENLSYPQERIKSFTLEEAARTSFENLNLVVLNDD